jgi:hypothetical protein
MKYLKLAVLGTAMSVALGFSGHANAFSWTETSYFAGAGAGDTTATAEVTSSATAAPLDNIFGFLSVITPVNSNPLVQVDVFKIYINSYATFSARTLSANPDDTALFLFDAAGKGVQMNDDNGADLLSTLPASSPIGPAANGFYFLAVAVGGFVAQDASSMNLFMTGSFTDVLAGAPGVGALAGWDKGFATLTESPMTYDIALTGAQAAVVPEPAAALLLCGGLVGLLLRRSLAKSPRQI